MKAFVASNLYAGQHPKLQHKFLHQGKPILVPLPGNTTPFFLEDLNTALLNLDFHNQNNSDINITCNNFNLMFNNILNQYAPLMFASRKETRSFHKPWLNKVLLTSVSKKNALYNKMLSKNNPSISAKYKFYRNKITHHKESLKQNYYRSKFENCRNDVKKTWKVFNEIISTKTKKQSRCRNLQYWP